MPQIQTARAVEIITPLGDDTLLFHRMTATETLGRLYRVDLELLSKDPDIKFEDLLGQNVTVRLELPQDKTRYFNGFVSRFTLSGSLGDLSVYQATVHPWLWFLTRTADCRIFQEMTVPDIIKQVFRDHGFTDFEEALSGTYRTWPYCVQYRETDFNFVSRLMEQEGIYYYFKHEKDKHLLVLSDAIGSHEAYPGYEQLPFYPPDEHRRREEHHIHQWTVSQEVQPGVYALNDFDFERPKADLNVKQAVQREHARATLEIFDYPGEYIQTSDGEGYVRARIEELHAEYEQAQGQSNARGLCTGSLFTLTHFPRQDQNREYLVVSATHEVESDAYTSGSESQGKEIFTCSFTALPSKEPFRPERITPKPLVQGPQTAIVTGPSGEEIHTDKYGRVKVQFHWDRYGKNDENSSCWVRVSHPTAGQGWGAVQIPRIGQEVIVDFLEGDPDHPIITGRVYNASQMPPYELPVNATQSGMKSRSSKGGGADNFNEIRFEDKKGQELVYLHGEKDWTINIENDKTQTIGHDESLNVGNNRTHTIAANQTEKIGANLSQSVSSNKTETITIAKALTIGAAYQVTVGGAMNETVGAVKAEEIIGAKIVAVGAHSNETVAVSKSVDAKADITEKAGKNFSIDAGQDATAKSGKKMMLSAGDDFGIKGEKNGVIDIKDQLTIKVGKASITLKKNGDISLQGAKINIKGSGDITIKGSKILEN